MIGDPGGEMDIMRGALRSVSRSGRSSSRDSSLASGNPSSNFSGKLPLAEDFFPVPRLSSKETKYLLGLAKHACKEVVYYSRQSDGPMDWLHLCSEDGVDVFQGVDNSSSGTQVEDKSLTYLRGACKIYATIDEISDFFKLDTPEKLTGFAQTVGKDLLDQKTLLTLATPTEDNPKHYVAVKWTAVESPSKLARNRDFCYIECHDEFLDTNTRRRGWVRSIHSIRLPFCPPLHRSHGLVRGSFYRSGYIFTESAEKGCVDAVHTLHVDIKGNAPNWLKIMTMKRRIKNIDQVNRYFQLRRLTQGKLLGDLELPAKDGVARCQRCETRFGFFHRKRLCRKCGKVVCTPCGNEFLLDYGALGHKKVRICVECSESMTLGDDTPAMGRSAKKTQGTDVRPVYDDSISSSLSQSKESRQFSIEEQEYYLQNEDASGIADMEDAKRMHDEFQKLLKSSQNGSTGSDRGDPLSQRHFDPNAQSLIGAASASGDTQPVDTSASDLPPWEEQVQLGHSGDYEMNGDDELGLPPSKSEQVHLQTLFEEKLRQERSQRARTMIHDPDFHSRRLANQGEQRRTVSAFGRDRAHAIVRSESADSLRLSTEWGEEYYVGKASIKRTGFGANTSFHSSGSGRSRSSSAGLGASQMSVESIPTLAMDQSFASTMGFQGSGKQPPLSFISSGIEFNFANGAIPKPPVEPSRDSKHGNNDEVKSIDNDVDSQRRIQDYFSARNARLAQLGSRPSAVERSSIPQPHSSVEPPVDHERAMLARSRGPGVGAGSDPPVRRPLTRTELGSPYTSVSDDFTSDLHYRNDEVAATDDEAFRLAMSAMRLYEEERGHKVQVTDKTRQAALTKMMEVYAREIERSQLHDPAPRNRGPIAAAHILHEEVDTMPQIRRTVSDDRSTTVYGSPLQVYTRDEGLAMARRQRRAASRSKQEIRTNVYAPVAHRRRGVSADSHEYRDLSDLTSSAFQAFQMNSLGPRDAPKLPEAQIQSSEGSDSINDSYKPAERYPQQPSSLFQRESTSTTGMLNSKSDGPSGAGGATYGSGTSSEVPNMESRPNSLYEVPDSETFSDMDLTDLPHLMRNDDPRRIAMESDRRSLDSGARSSFTDLQRWTENSNLQALAEQDNLSITDADEYVEEPRLSDLLSPLRLEEQQQVEDDASSISSSQFEWIGSMGASVTACVDEDFESSYPPVSHQVQTASYTDLTNSLFGNNALSESMVAHDGKQPQHPNRSPQYPKQRSLSALLSEYSDSERSSLPSFAEYGAQPELEPEYIEAINNLDPKLPSELDEQYDGRQRHRQNSVPLEGAARVRRRSSIPPELEGMTKRELFL